MFIVKHRKIFFLISALLVAASIVVLAVYGLNFGIDFKGGSLMEIEFKENRPSNQEIQNVLADMDLGEMSVQPTGDKNMILRMKDIDENTHQRILEALRGAQGESEGLEELRFESVGPIIGQELKKKAIYSIVLALVFILIYVALAFR